MDAIEPVPSIAAPVESPSAWRAEAMREDRSWEWRLLAAESGELRTAVAQVRSKGLRAAEFDKAEFALPNLTARLAQAREELEEGRGVVLLRGLPVDESQEEDAARLLWGIGTHL